MTLMSGSIERKQLKMRKGNIIFCNVDCFCIQEKKRKMKPEVFCVLNTEGTASAMIGSQN